MSKKNMIPPFILKTYQMLEDQMSENVISWVEQGTAFRVQNQEELEKFVLQIFFKHSNYSSFVRQLNIYGFKKVRSKEGFIFKHNFFRKGMITKLQYIKKKSQEDSVVPTLIQEEEAFHLQEKQNQFKECSINIKETNKLLKEDMKVLQETSSYLMDQIQNLSYFIYNQNVDIEVKFKQVGQMLQAINEELQSENKKDAQLTNTSIIRTDQFFQDLKVDSPNPYVDYNSTALNPLDYECFIDSFL